ncbi:hypothetical protein HOG21_00905 [bacterium]|nr:hypothetical protein [bacterium]
MISKLSKFNLAVRSQYKFSKDHPGLFDAVLYSSFVGTAETIFIFNSHSSKSNLFVIVQENSLY